MVTSVELKRNSDFLVAAECGQDYSFREQVATSCRCVSAVWKAAAQDGWICGRRISVITVGQFSEGQTAKAKVMTQHFYPSQPSFALESRTDLPRLDYFPTLHPKSDLSVGERATVSALCSAETNGRNGNGNILSPTLTMSRIGFCRGADNAECDEC